MKKIYLSLLTVLLLSSIGSAQVAVIAHKSVPAQDISSREVLDFYTGDIRVWDDGKAVIVFDLKSKGDIKNTFYKFLGKTTSRMKSIWMKNMLAGEGDPPEALSSETEMLEKVANTPGAIGFVSEKIASTDVKILTVITDQKE